MSPSRWWPSVREACGDAEPLVLQTFRALRVRG